LRSTLSGLLLAAAAAALAVSADQAPLRAQQSALSRESRPAGESATVLPDGSVLLIGGETAKAAVAVRRPDGRVIPLATSPLTPRAWHTATLLADGSVLLAGGVDARGRTIAAPERFVPGTATFEALPADGFAARAHHTATLLTDGRVLLVGGDGGGAARDDADVWARSRNRRNQSDRRSTFRGPATRPTFSPTAVCSSPAETRHEETRPICSIRRPASFTESVVRGPSRHRCTSRLCRRRIGRRTCLWMRG
jgi:hypothetical protein